MASIIGINLKVSIFGESHGKAIGVNIDGLPPGIKLNLGNIRYEMMRRAPARTALSTARREEDEFEIISGYFNHRTTGTPLCAIIRNQDKRSKDYERTKSLMRPSHADYTGYIKYRGHNDYRGGGHFSGRLTASLVFAGAIAKEILKEEDISIGSHIKSIGEIEDVSFDYIDLDGDILDKLNKEALPVLDQSKAKEMEELILKVKKEGDSVGGVVETAVVNLRAGIGSPIFDSLDSHLAKLIFSIPGVKGVEFGSGFSISRMLGSQANDEFYMKDGQVRTFTNHSGGIVGGISNGMPIIIRTAIKPTPSIGKRQRTIDIEKGEGAELNIKGRHDPCIVPRAVAAIEAVVAIGILDLMMEEGKWK